MKITIIGAGSPYSPEIIKELYQRRDRLPVERISLCDINEKRLSVMEGFLNRYCNKLGMKIAIDATPDRDKALEGADFVITQYRVGGNAARVQDELIPLKHGFIGQETTGAGGMMKALRTIPVAVDLARAMERICPNAWMINYTNPSGMIAEAMQKYSNAKTVGLCAGGIRPAQAAAAVLGCPQEDIRYDFFGLNHCNFAYNITHKGIPVTGEELDKILAWRHNEVTPELIKAYGLFPSGYMMYYYRTQKQYDKITSAEKTRGQQVMDMEKEIYEGYADEQNADIPALLQKRGGGGYSEVAIGILEALYTNKDKWMICNVPNAGTVKFLPDDAVIETACIVNASGIKPLPQPDVPKFTWGMISAVKNYEQLAIEAAMTGDRDLVLAALAAHPLVRDVDRALPMMEELLIANRIYLPNFF